MRIVQKIRKFNIDYWIFIGILWLFFALLVNYVQLKFSDSSDYFTYTSLTSKDSYDVWEDLYFVSNITRKKETDMKYVDILKCQFEWADFSWFSQSIGYTKDLMAWVYISVWRYNGAVPPREAVCFIDSSPTVTLDFGLEKTQRIKSNTFTIWK